MKAQEAAWNRGDVPAFMQEYEDSTDTTFIGLTVRKGFQPILKRYQENYTSREEMGTLSYTDLDVRLLPNGCGKTEIALVTGKFHLERAAHGPAKKDDGIFSLVWRKGAHGWKIVLDHTS
jgi:ketosteroid isomerase-like protein